MIRLIISMMMLCGVFAAITGELAAAHAPPASLESPVDVNASDVGRGRAMVSWKSEYSGENSFHIERNPPSSEGEMAATGKERSLIDECGDGRFSYRVQVRGQHGQSVYSAWADVTVTSGAASTAAMPGHATGRNDEILRGLRIGTDGWVVLHPSSGTRIVYVSSSTGSDKNDGLSEEAPKRSIRAGYQMLRHGHPDWLLLKSGDVWKEGELWWDKSGRSPAERMVVATYGGDERAVWKTGKESAIRGNPREGRSNAYLVFRDLHLVPHDNDGTASASGFMLMNGWRDVLIENCRVEGFRVNMVFQAYTATVRQRNIVVRRNIIVDAVATNDAHAQGIFADGVDGLLIEENVLDQNGWGPDHPTANMFRHNTYIQTETDGDGGCTNVVSRGNISARASATGLMQRVGGVVEGNLLLANPIGIVFGQRGGRIVSGAVRGNVVLDARDIRPGEPRGTGLWVTNTRGVDIADNIVAHQRSGTGNVVGINVDGTYGELALRRNIVYDWRQSGDGGGAALAWYGEAAGEVRVEGNHFQQVRGGSVVERQRPHCDAIEYAENLYYSANSRSDEFSRRTSFAQWAARSGDKRSEFSQQPYPDPERSIDDYMKSLGRSGGLEAFLREARLQSRANWRNEFTAGAVIAYIREGFGVDE